MCYELGVKIKNKEQTGPNSWSGLWRQKIELKSSKKDVAKKE